MNDKKKDSLDSRRNTAEKIKFSIGAKLITIISIIVIVSLGSITALVSWLVHSDLRITAEVNNFDINRKSAMEAESMLINMRSNSRIFIQTITSAAAISQETMIRDSTNFFFAENPQVAAVFFAVPGSDEQLFVNGRFFTSRDINESLVNLFFENQRAAISRSVRGETLLQNAAPYFSRPLLALFFPWQNNGVGGVLFSSENINNNFGFGVN